MLDPRIYRTGFVAVALAVVVLAFSLTDQPGPMHATLAPDAFSGANAYTTMEHFNKVYPDRRPGSFGDQALADDVAGRLSSIQGFSVSKTLQSEQTVDGVKQLETVTATRAGQASGSIVIVAHRDALEPPSTAELSGTAVLIELARVLAGETQHHTIVLASTSGSAGAAGATALARSLGQPVDAVIALGDLAGTTARGMTVVPWSTSKNVAPPALRNTVAAALASQAGMKPGSSSLAGQFARLAFPFTLSEQGPFGARGMPAVTLSLSGEKASPPDEPISQTPDQIQGLGRTVLQSINALDGGPEIPTVRPYLIYGGKVVPYWAIRLFVLALILPVLGATIDGLARARRRGQSITRWIVWVLAGALPFVLALLVALAFKPVGLITAAPPGPVAPGVIPMHSTGVLLLVVLVLVLALSFYAFRPLLIRLGGIRRAGKQLTDPAPRGAAAAAVLLVMCAVALATWVTNPFTAALMIPALHLWMWVVDPEVRLRRAVTVALLLIGLAPPLLLVLHYANLFGYGPVEVAWNGLLMIASGQITIAAALEWSVMLGCVASVIVIAVRGLHEPRPEELQITVRGPINYAGPGSLGGTESALRR
jgi:Peptidase family M28